MKLLLRVFLALTTAGCLLAPAARAGESGPPMQSQKRAAVLVDIARLRLELGTREDDAAALESLKEAARLDPGNIRARFWLGAAWLRNAGLGSGRDLDVEMTGRGGLEFEAVFRLSALEHSGESEDLRLRSITLLDLAAAELPASEKRFSPWWKKRRAELLAGQGLVNVSHTVERGDSLSAIAKQYYGDAALTARIAEANPGIDLKNLKVGLKLNVPGVRTEPVAPRPAVDAAEKELLTRLSSAPTVAERRLAASRLAGRECLMAVPALAGALRADGSQWVRVECAKSLGVIGSPDAEPALCAALRNDPWPDCRLEAARALARVGARGSVPALAAGLEDSSSPVVAASARALGALGIEEAAGPLVAALESKSEPARRAAAAGLAELERRKSLPAVSRERIGELASKGEAPGRSAALLALARIDQAAAAKLLADALGAEAVVRRAALEGFYFAACDGAVLDAKTVARLAELASAGGDPAGTLSAAAAAARGGKGTPAGRDGLLALAALLEEHRAVLWGDFDEPVSVAQLAARELTLVTGAKLGAERSAWTDWIEKEIK